jgi:hypothetical protein
MKSRTQSKEQNVILDSISEGVIFSYGDDIDTTQPTGTGELVLAWATLEEHEPKPVIAAYETPITVDGLVAYYALENNTNDSSGNELHGTIVGDPNFVTSMKGYGIARFARHRVRIARWFLWVHQPRRC